MFRFEEIPQIGPPPNGISRLRRPDPPSGRLPFFGPVAYYRAGGRWPSLPSWHSDRPNRPAQRSSTSTGPSCAGPAARCSRTRCAPPGLVSRHIPGEKLLYQLFNTVGETLPSMALARQAVTFREGSLAGRRPGGGRQRGRPPRRPWCSRSPSRCSRCTATRAARSCSRRRRPYDLVKPFADRLGLDGVVATRYGVEDDDDTYSGDLAGPFVWSTGKLAAVREWAEEQRHRPRRRATPTPTASTTRRCWPRSGTRSSSTPTRAWC